MRLAETFLVQLPAHSVSLSLPSAHVCTLQLGGRGAIYLHSRLSRAQAVYIGGASKFVTLRVKYKGKGVYIQEFRHPMLSLG